MTIERVRAVCAPRGDRSRGEQKGMSEIAVVLCTRNGEPTLGAVLEGYVSQETSGISWEMVIVDNGSTDETEAVVRGYQSRLPITLVYEPIPGKNRGLNRGLADVKAPFIIITDDDAVPAPNFLQSWWDTAQHLPDHDLFGGRIEPDFPSPPPEWIRRTDYLCAILFARCDMPEGSVEPVYIFGPNMAVRRRVLDAGLTFDESIGPNGTDPNYPMGAETEFLVRATQAGHRSYFTRGPLVRHIVRPHQMEPEFWFSRAYRSGRGVARLMLAQRARTGLGARMRRGALATLHRAIWLYWGLCPYQPSRQRAHWLLHWMRGFRQEA